jgi:hypothetical protein
MLALAVLAAALALAAPQHGGHSGVVEVCLQAGALGLAGHKPHALAAFWWNGTRWLSVPLYVETVTVNVVHISELNKSAPSVGRAMVMPPELGPQTRLCMYLPAGAPAGWPRETPGISGRKLAGVHAVVEDWRGARHHVFISTEIPAASPADLSGAAVNARVVSRAEVRPDAPEGGEAAARAEPLYDNYYATSAVFSYVGSFKLLRTDKFTTSTGSSLAASGEFELPPGTFSMEVVITAASTPGLTYKVVVGERYAGGGWTYTYYYVYLLQSAPYAVVYHSFKSSDAKRVYVYVGPVGYSGTYTVDAFVTVHGEAKAYWQRFHAALQPVSGGLSGLYCTSRSDGYYIVLPGFTAPPGTAVSSPYMRTQYPRLTGSITMCGQVGDYANIYWGTRFLGRVYASSASGSCKTFTFDLWADPTENVETGGSTHAVLIGPVCKLDSLTVRYLAVYGFYRPEMNRETSRVWRDVLPWGYAAYNSFVVPGGSYRAEMKIYDRGAASATGSMRIAIYITPYQGQRVCYDALRIRLALNDGNNMLTASEYKIYAEGGELERVVSLFLGWVAQLFGTMGAVLAKIGNVMGWALLAKDTVGSVLSSSVSASTAGNYLEVRVNVSPLDQTRPVIARVVMADTYEGNYAVSVKDVYMCGVIAYSDAAFPVPAMRYYKPVSYVSSTATQNVDTYRTFTCGKQEDLSYLYQNNELASEFCQKYYYR